MAYEIIETTFPNSDSNSATKFTVIDPHPTHPIVDSIHDNRADAEEALAEIRLENTITDSLEDWIQASADEHGVNRSVITNIIFR